METEVSLITSSSIKNRIYTVRGVQVMLDKDLAELYGVETKVLNQAMKRNEGRFPKEFCFKLVDDEYQSISSRSQIVTLKIIH